jgi:hypothetical protein
MSGIGGGSRGPGELVGDSWDDHRVEGEDGSQQMEAGPAAEERFGEPSREGQGDLIYCGRQSRTYPRVAVT